MLMERGGVWTLQWEQRVFQGAESAGVWFFPYLNVRCVGYCILSKHTWIEASLSSVIKSNSIRVDLAKLWFPAVCSLWLRVIHTLKNTITTSSVSVCRPRSPWRNQHHVHAAGLLELGRVRAARSLWAGGVQHLHDHHRHQQYLPGHSVSWKTSPDSWARQVPVPPRFWISTSDEAKLCLRSKNVLFFVLFCRQPPHCVPETYTNATSWYKLFTTVRDSDTKYSQEYNPFWCYKGAIGKVYHALNPKLTVIVPDVSRRFLFSCFCFLRLVIRLSLWFD